MRSLLHTRRRRREQWWPHLHTVGPKIPANRSRSGTESRADLRERLAGQLQSPGLRDRRVIDPSGSGNPKSTSHPWILVALRMFCFIDYEPCRMLIARTGMLNRFLTEETPTGRAEPEDMAEAKVSHLLLCRSAQLCPCCERSVADGESGEAPQPRHHRRRPFASGSKEAM